MAETQQGRVVTLDARAGRALWHLGALLTFKALGEETGGQYWALEGLADRQMAVPLHLHTREDEIWYVLEGEILFTIDDHTISGGPGTFAHIPRGTPHTFQVLSDTARWFGYGTPAGLDRWFFETGELAPTLTIPPPPTGPIDPAPIIASLQRYGTETVGPPPPPLRP